ncbi:MAG: beta-1,6-N-acetylglucosaminyltransferase [Litoreibacter sp.]
MSVGFVMLVHTGLDRAAQTARHWAGCGNPVVIHVDKDVPDHDFDRFKHRLNDLENLEFADRQCCEWGGWSIVAATQRACEKLLHENPDVSHVFLVSGSCLPLRPIDELQNYLDERPDTDFIESVTTDEVDWTIGGLHQERFTLRFPFNWKRNRQLFDAYVRFQRRFSITRKIPKDIVPHLGSQWWCLSRRTLAAILQDPRRPEFDTYFKHVWIPDESYFQTLSRLHSTNLESRTLTLSKFDHQGKPHVFYDDHIQLLRRSNCFVARKIWPSAGRLYREFLAESENTSPMAEPNPLRIDRLFSHATQRRVRGRSGLSMPGRFPRSDMNHDKTSGRYVVFEGFNELFDGFEAWLADRTGNCVHGNIFSKEAVEFADNDEFFRGSLPTNVIWRDYRCHDFLKNLIWNTRGDMQCFQFGPADQQDISEFLVADGNADIFIITGAWAISLFHSELDFQILRKRAAHLQRVENAHLHQIRQEQVKARVHIWNLAEFIEAPIENLQQILDMIGGRPERQITEFPLMADLTGFGKFLQNLKNQGMNPQLMGDFSMVDAARAEKLHSRPFLIKK